MPEMKSSIMCIAALLLTFMSQSAMAWDEHELEIFDIVEEVNQNFYEYMGLSQDASSTDIRKAYRQLSLVLHPDKNSAEDAEVKFRWLVSIYEVLKDPAKREVYNRVLVEGLPDWRMPVYYYRRMRKLGLAESCLYLFVIITVIQYCVNWAAYLERKFTLQESISAHSKKMMRKVKKGQNCDELTAALEIHEENMLGPRPTCFDTLPFQMFRGCKYLVFTIPTLPTTIYAMYKEAKEKKLEEERLRLEEEAEMLRKEEEKKERKEQKAKRKQVERYRDRTGEKTAASSEDDAPPVVDAFKQPANALQIWTDQDLAKLARLMKKYPSGTPERWEKIADTMERLSWEVTKMARKVKDVAYQVPISKSAQGVTGLEDKKMVRDNCMEYQTDDTADSDDDDEEEEQDSDDENYGVYSVATKENYVPVEVKSKKKTKGGKSDLVGVAESSGSKRESVAEQETEQQWSQQQQKALELALSQFPKGTTERWERIASKVPGKTKEQCMLRFKELAEIIKKKKECGNGSVKEEATV